MITLVLQFDHSRKLLSSIEVKAVILAEGLGLRHISRESSSPMIKPGYVGSAFVENLIARLRRV